MGKPVARVSDTDACPIPGHGPNPVSAGSGNVLLGNSGGGAAMSPVGPLQILGQAVTHLLAPAAAMQKSYSVQFRATDETSGEPVSDLPYRLQMADGTTLRGSTDEDGYTMRVNTAQAESVQLFWEPHVEDDDCDQHSDICGCD